MYNYKYICDNNRHQSSLTMVFAMSFPQISPPKFSVHPHLVLVAHPCNLYALGRSMQLLTSGDKLVKVDQAILVAVNQTKKGCKILQQQDRCARSCSNRTDVTNGKKLSYNAHLKL